MTEWFESGWDVSMEGDRTQSPSLSVRLWMPKESEKVLIFLSSKPDAVFFEHNPKIGKDFKNFCTCLQMVDKSCPLCKLDVGRYKVAAFTVVDASGYTDKNGNKHQNERKLLLAKRRTFEKIARKAKQRESNGESLKGAIFRVYRGSDNTSPSVGEDFEFEGMVEDWSQLPESEPLDYETYLAPDEELCRNLAMKVKAEQDRESSAEKKADDFSGDDVPF